MVQIRKVGENRPKVDLNKTQPDSPISSDVVQQDNLLSTQPTNTQDTPLSIQPADTANYNPYQPQLVVSENKGSFNEQANRVCDSIDSGVSGAINSFVNQLTGAINKISGNISKTVTDSINSVSGTSEYLPKIEEHQNFSEPSTQSSYDILSYNRITGPIDVDTFNDGN